MRLAVPQSSGRRSSLHEQYLQNIPLAIVVNSEKPLVSIDINSTLEDALTTLCKHKYQALPVWNKKTKEYEYVASRLDIISMIAWTTGNEWRKSPLLDILNAEVHTVHPGIFAFTMNDAVVKCLESYSKGVHHILIKNEEYDQKVDNNADDEESDDAIVEYPYYWLNQWEVVAFLYRNIKRMSAIVDAPINKIGLVKERLLKNEKIYTVNCKMLAKEAFKKFIVNRHDVIAIVNKKGKLVSHISESDIVGVGPEAVQFLLNDDFLTIQDFMDAVNKENGRKLKPVCCKKNEITSKMMQIVVKRKSNQIFVVDDDGKPLKCVTMNDIICKFSPMDYLQNNTSRQLCMMPAGKKWKDIKKKIMPAAKLLKFLSSKENSNPSSNYSSNSTSD